jgi:hypothetical protein
MAWLEKVVSMGYMGGGGIGVERLFGAGTEVEAGSSDPISRTNDNGVGWGDGVGWMGGLELRGMFEVWTEVEAGLLDPSRPTNENGVGWENVVGR